MDSAQFDGLINNTNQEIAVSQGDDSAILPDGDITVKFWNDAKADWVGAIEIDDAGAQVQCPHSRMQITTTGSTYVRVTKVPRR